MDYNELFEYRDGKLYNKINRNGRAMKGAEAGTRRHNGYRKVKGDGRYVFAHRVIWEMHNKPIPNEMFIDHINRERDDNRIENLRLVTRYQNAVNSKLSTNNTSGIKGITKRVIRIFKDGNIINRTYWRATFSGKILYNGAHLAKAYRARLKAIRGCEYATSV